MSIFHTWSIWVGFIHREYTRIISCIAEKAYIKKKSTLDCLGYTGNHRLPSCNKASIKIPEWPPGSIIWESRRWIAIPECHVTSST